MTKIKFTVNTLILQKRVFNCDLYFFVPLGRFRKDVWFIYVTLSPKGEFLTTIRCVMHKHSTTDPFSL